MWKQNASYLAKHSELGSKNFNKRYLKITQKALKQPLQHVNFQKFSGGACPRTLLELFFITISFKFVLPKKITLRKKCKSVEIMPPPLAKFLAILLRVRTKLGLGLGLSGPLSYFAVFSKSFVVLYGPLRCFSPLRCLARPL